MNQKELEKCAHFLNKKYLKNQPKIAIILGSGLGPFTELLQDKTEIPYKELPSFPRATVKGHDGVLAIGSIAGVDLIVFKGRFHAYEGHELDKVVAPVRLAAKLGIKNIIVTNASGGINPNYKPGDLVYLTDHINLTGMNVLTGVNNDEMGPRFPDMSQAYHPKLRDILIKTANKINIEIKPGIYAGVLGPTYETPAEVRMLGILGCDLVGMSTIQEVIAARHLALNLSCISCITNYAAGIKNEKLNHDDVKEVALQSMDKFKKLIEAFIIELGGEVESL